MTDMAVRLIHLFLFALIIRRLLACCSISILMVFVQYKQWSKAESQYFWRD